MDIEEAKEAYEGLKKNAFIVESIDKEFFLKFGETVLNELDKKDKEIEELKQDNAKQWEERCKLTFKLQEAEERLSQIELQILEED